MEIHTSARKHGISDADIEHAVNHALASFDLGDADTPYRHIAFGPDRAGNMIEVVVLTFDGADEREMAIHAMPIRTRYLNLLPKPGEPNA